MGANNLIYLDHAAATPVTKSVIDAMAPYLTELFYNPSSPYLPANKVKQDYEAARHRLALTIGAKPDEIIMTAGATESIRLALTAASEAHVVSSSIEHHAVINNVKLMSHTFVDPQSDGLIDPNAIKEAIRSNTQLVTVALANNEIGTVQSLRKIAEAVEDERQERLSKGSRVPIWLHTDASQCPGVIDINTARLGVDMMTLNAAKCYGPKQVGLLWRRAGVVLRPILSGGGQEMGLRSGTENVAGAVGFAEALARAEKKRKSHSQSLSEMRDKLQTRLVAEFEDMVISGSQKKRLPGFLHIAFPGLDAERLVFALESRGVLVATGSACAANSGTRSHVLTAIGLDDATADGSLRISLGATNDSEMIDRAADILVEEIRREKDRTGR